MIPLISTIRRLLMKRQYVIDNFEYQFLSVEESEDGAQVDFTVNVILPKKGQSYVEEKFNTDCYKIIERIYDFLDFPFAYNQNLLVDGKHPHDVYISPEDYQEILESLKQNIKTVTLRNPNSSLFKETISANIQIYFNPNKQVDYDRSAEMIQFHLLYDIDNIKLDGKPVTLNHHQVETFGEVFNEKLMYSDAFVEQRNEIFYQVLSDTIGISGEHIFIDSSLWMNKINGESVNIEGNSFTTNFSPRMFI